jgi:hypothetical protein
MNSGEGGNGDCQGSTASEHSRRPPGGWAGLIPGHNVERHYCANIAARKMAGSDDVWSRMQICDSDRFRQNLRAF